MKPYATHDFVASSKFEGEMFGKVWTNEEKGRLYDLFAAGHTLSHLMELMQRPASGIVAKLKLARVISQPGMYSDYEITSRGHELRQKYQEVQANQTEKEETMNAKTIAPVIETVVMIQGQNAAGLSDDHIFDLIAQLEAQVERLSKVKNQPKKLADKIEGINLDIVKLVTYVDTREA